MFEQFIKKIQHRYLKVAVKTTKIPDFVETYPERKHFIFTGVVQGIGFRYQAQVLAQCLFLTGWVRNLNNGQVEMEIQGAPEKIYFFLSRMQKTARIKISRIETNSKKVDWNEHKFSILDTR
ncbi:acylphosphatase [Ligilactobacillus sp. WILCCON 0076]|uniref:acylphosphatase n=1 Tax=Ligilactobacillus ubinensis TaxID=2876789 RepID=A0A9X2JM21_9LACO|nr:acylphosphatase [Ligilactobacillus ubinensis]MCP0886696.1 acylphosphatase [Ligilactobacillus ubinensis]